MLLFPLTCLLVTMVSSAPSEGCGRPLDQLTPGLDHRLTVSVSEPGRPDIQRWAIIICIYHIIMAQGLCSSPPCLL